MKKDERGIEEDINSLKYRFLLFFISVIIFIVAFVVSYSIYFSNQTNSFRDDIAVKRITNSSNEINKYVSFSIATRENQLYSIKLLLDNNKDKTDFEIMNSYLPNSTFDKIGFVKNDGYWFSDLTHDENTVVMDVKNSLSQNSVNLVTNISVDHKNVYFCYNYESSDPSILGIVGSISIDKLSQSFYSNIYNSSNSILIVKKSGEIITKTSEKYSHIFNENILFDLKTNFKDSFNTEEFEFTIRAHHNGRPNLCELHQLAKVFEDISNTGFHGLHCMDTEYVYDETGEHLTARFIVTRDLLEFHHF